MMTAMQNKVVYVSGEETERQVKLRADRLSIGGNGLFLLAETDLDTIIEQVEALSPGMVVVDSVQAVSMSDMEASPGSISQVRECTSRLMQWTKSSGVPVFVTGHVTKEGAIAGPKTLEHIVDVVLYLEGEQFSAHRLLRCVKNRFGSTNEIGVFEMKEQGLVEVTNPSTQYSLGERQDVTVVLGARADDELRALAGRGPGVARERRPLGPPPRHGQARCPVFLDGGTDRAHEAEDVGARLLGARRRRLRSDGSSMLTREPVGPEPGLADEQRRASWYNF